jgi:uncharacterized protein (DUF2147 family)
VRKITLLSFCLAILSISTNVCAGPTGPAGLWRSYDDASAKANALIRIAEVQGVLQGRIEKLILGPSEDQDPICEKCKGSQKDKRITGMLIMHGLVKENDKYVNGQILDPETGETYQCTLTLDKDGKKLNVRGFIGLPMLGRSQMWIRVE